MSIAVTISAEGRTLRQGEELAIEWGTANAPGGSAVALFPAKALTGRRFEPIAAGLPLSGRHTWRVPIFVPQPIPCAPEITGGCAGSMNAGTPYVVIARIYTPADANLVEYGPGKKFPHWVASAQSRPFMMLPAR
ncbi:MAG: hypothetical protein ACHQAY_12705 [Hyphomicrobiales bacterium]